MLTAESHGWIAVVDDDYAVRTSLARALSCRGVRTEGFASAEEFLERFTHSRPTAIVLDVQLGGLSGFELQQILEAQPAAPPPIIFITGRAELLSSPQCARALACLIKPFGPDRVLGLLASVGESESARG